MRTSAYAFGENRAQTGRLPADGAAIPETRHGCTCVTSLFAEFPELADQPLASRCQLVGVGGIEDR